MSKTHMPHWRYIACRIDAQRMPDRRGLQVALTRAARAAGTQDGDLPELTRYDAPHFIVKVRHHQLALARAWLPMLRNYGAQDEHAMRVETLLSSGTIKTLTDRLGVLRKR